LEVCLRDDIAECSFQPGLHGTTRSNEMTLAV